MLSRSRKRTNSLPLVDPGRLRNASRHNAPRTRFERFGLYVRLVIFFFLGACTIQALSWAFSSSSKASGSVLISRNYQISTEPVVLILCPVKNAIEHIWEFYHRLDNLSYPRELIQVGILSGDSSDKTYERSLELAQDRQVKASPSARYNKISVFSKDFGGSPPSTGDSTLKDAGDNVGKSRHDFSRQIARRKVLAQSRSWLLSAAMTPEVDWVLWLDVDVIEYRPTLIQDLLAWSRNTSSQVVVPNCMWHTYNEMGAYDRNNWAETPKSLEYKKTLKADDILIEGYKELETHRNLMAFSSDTSDPISTMELNGVGGCCTLVDASLHRKGAVFPAYSFDNQVETEGFAQMVKRLGGKMIGLPGYHVYHGLYG